MLKIDAHIHYCGDHPDSVELLQKLDLRLLNVCVAHGADDPWRSRAEIYRRLSHKYPDRYAWCTTFDPPGLDDPNYVERTIDDLERHPDALACKVWKNIGMRIRKPSGEFLMADDPLFDPIYEHLTRTEKTLLMHIGEPLACWQPLDENDPHNGYYSLHPEWHMYSRPDFPSHRDLVDARDRVLAKHPKLRVVGAHLASLEYDVAEVARRLDLYPNLAVDTSARAKDLALQDSTVVREFFLQYPDRILFGTDIVRREPQSTVTEAARRNSERFIRERYETEFAYYESDREVTVRGVATRGLGLPSHVLEEFYHANASQWYPGL